MRYLLDTNAWITYFRSKDLAFVARLEAQPTSNLRLSTVVLGVLLFGAYHSGPVQVIHHKKLIENIVQIFEIVEFDTASADQYARIREHLSAAGTPIGPNDLLIAATALAHGLTLVTHNTEEFSRVPGLAVEDWQAPRTPTPP